jgi:hypothetical protein
LTWRTVYTYRGNNIIHDEEYVTGDRWIKWTKKDIQKEYEQWTAYNYINLFVYMWVLIMELFKLNIFICKMY